MFFKTILIILTVMFVVVTLVVVFSCMKIAGMENESMENKNERKNI